MKKKLMIASLALAGVMALGAPKAEALGMAHDFGMPRMSQEHGGMTIDKNDVMTRHFESRPQGDMSPRKMGCEFDSC